VSVPSPARRSRRIHLPIDPDQLAASLRGLERSGDDPDVLGALSAAVLACVEIFDVAGCGLMIADEHQILRHVMSSDAPGHALEDVEAEHAEGPCTDCFVDNVIVTTTDLAADRRWPKTASAVVPLGVRAVLGIPIRLGAVPLGTLDVYRREPHEWDETERRALSRYGDVMEIIFTSALAADRAGELTDQLQYALDHRIVIERAVGYIMGTERIDAVTAFNVLRKAARAQRRKVGEIADEVLRHAAPAAP
jgi:GAF domain-containing protein